MVEWDIRPPRPTPPFRMSSPTNIFTLLGTGAPGDTALAAPGRPDVTYDGLRRHVRATIAALNRHGIGRNDRVAIVLPNGPEMASAYVAIAAAAATAPLNPSHERAVRRCRYNDDVVTPVRGPVTGRTRAFCDVPGPHGGALAAVTAAGPRRAVPAGGRRQPPAADDGGLGFRGGGVDRPQDANMNP